MITTTAGAPPLTITAGASTAGIYLKISCYIGNIGNIAGYDNNAISPHYMTPTIGIHTACMKI